jgi:hypothetical protein
MGFLRFAQKTHTNRIISNLAAELPELVEGQAKARR